jgi:hypothetical protein
VAGEIGLGLRGGTALVADFGGHIFCPLAGGFGDGLAAVGIAAAGARRRVAAVRRSYEARSRLYLVFTIPG